MRRRWKGPARAAAAMGALLVAAAAGRASLPAAPRSGTAPPAALARFFQPPPEYANDFGDYRSPLRFASGELVRDPAAWQRRREEIRRTWFSFIGAWPPLLEQPRVETLATERREGVTQRRVRLPVAPGRSAEGYLVLPDGRGPFPAALVVYYEPETAVGLKGEQLDFALQLARRGFVTLSIGSPPDTAYPAPGQPELQPLSYLAYCAVNAGSALAGLPEVDPDRIGVVGHSYGAKWAMFAACLAERFACSAWSDGGIVFDERRANVNYWEPWYLGFEAGRMRRPGIPSETNPRTGAYARLLAAGHDLHELHALMAPRPFLVSGGSEDPPERWKALNHAVAVNRLLGFENRVAMTNRSGHAPTPESNAHLYAFFEWALRE